MGKDINLEVNNMFKKTLKSQLSLTIAMVTLVTVTLISLLSNILINQKFKDYISQQQKSKTEEIVSSLNEQYNKNNHGWNEDFIHILGMYALYDGYIIKVYEDDGNVVWDAEQHDMSLCTQVMTDISQRMEETYPKISGKFTTSDYPLEENGKPIGRVSISYFGPFFLNENDFQFLSALNKILVGVGLFSLFFSIIMGWLLAKRISKPITNTIALAKEISDGNYDISFEGETNTKELNELVLATTHLANSLNEQEGLRKKLTADVAHELRTPLATVSSHLEAMIEGVWEPTEERLQSCHEEIGRITNLVKDLERLAKVEGDNLKPNKDFVDLSKIVHSVSRSLETEIYKKDLHLFIEGESVTVLADQERMRQVVFNLLSNAIKYTPKQGEIRIIIKETKDYGEIYVEDNGIGIPHEEQPFIFERFYRADKSRNRKQGGAGIGLAIVKSIVKAHGGHVAVESEVDKGSRFIIQLPKNQS